MRAVEDQEENTTEDWGDLQMRAVDNTGTEDWGDSEESCKCCGGKGGYFVGPLILLLVGTYIVIPNCCNCHAFPTLSVSLSCVCETYF